MVDDEFIRMVKELQKKIEYDEELTYSKTVITKYRNPIFFGVLDHPDAVGIIKGACGDTMKIMVHIVDEKILDARFWTDGCGATLAAGNMLIKMIKEKTIEEAKSISNAQLVNALDGLPTEHNHCAILAVNTLKQAIKQYRKKKVVKRNSSMKLTIIYDNELFLYDSGLQAD